MAAHTAAVYRTVMDDVINKIKETLRNQGIDEAVAMDLQKVWEQKLREQDTYTPDADLKEKANRPKRPRKQAAAAPTEQDVTQHAPIPSMPQHAPYLPPMDAFDMGRPQPFLNPAQRLQNNPMPYPQGINQPHAFLQEQQHQQPYEAYTTQQFLQSDQPPPAKRARTNAYVPAPSMTQQQQQATNFHQMSSYLQQQQAPPQQHLLQNYAAMPPMQLPPASALLPQHQQQSSQQQQQQQHFFPGSQQSPFQLDGADDEFDVHSDADDVDDLKDTDDGDEDETIPETDDYVLGLLEKKTRTKNKYKLTLRCGIMNLNGKDYVFSKATGDFDW